MHITFTIVLYFWIKGCRTPVLFKEGDTNRLSKLIQLQSTRTGNTHNTSVVDGLEWYILLSTSQQQIGMSRGTYRITHH